MGTEWSRPTKYVVAVGLALFVVFVLYLSRTIIPLLVVAGLIAFAVNPLIRFLQERLRFPRGLAIAVTYLAVLLLLPLAVLLLVTAITQAIQFVISIDYATLITNTSATLRDWLIQLRNWPIPFAPIDEYVDGLVDLVLETLSGANEAVEIQFPSFAELVAQLGSVLTITFGAVAGLLGNLFSSAIVFIFVFLSSIYLTTSAASYRDAMVNALPERFQPEAIELLRRIGKVWSAFFRGQVTLMLLIGLVVWVGLTLLGVPGALSLAVIAGLLEVVPNLGPVVATIPAVVVALLQGSTYLPVNNFVLAILVIGFYVLVQQLENSLIVPKVLGDAVELPALVVMSGVLVGGTVAGILGALLATPVIASGREILGYMYRKLLNEPPFPPEPEPEQPAPAPAGPPWWRRIRLPQRKAR